MGKYYFDDIFADKNSQLLGGPCSLKDNEKVTLCRSKLETGEDWLALAEALCTQMRCREAIDAYSKAIELLPDDARGYRGRGGRYLATAQPAKAIKDLMRCEVLQGDPLDLHYRIGLCEYMLGHYNEATHRFSKARPLCGDEMGIAVIYWHTLSCYRNGTDSTMLSQYHDDMNVGHHTAYRNAVRFCTGMTDESEFLESLKDEPDDMEYVIALYGFCIWLKYQNREADYAYWMKKLLSRDRFWFCFSYLCAWTDIRNA